MKKLKRRLSLTLSKRGRTLDESLSELAEQMTIDDVVALSEQQLQQQQHHHLQNPLHNHLHRSQPQLDQFRIPSAPQLLQGNTASEERPGRLKTFYPFRAGIIHENGVVHENPRLAAESADLDEVRRAADERYDVVSPVTVRLRNKQRRLSE
ncbi:unnamed protein product, partial [Candidula unifasciata]